ncbi:MAG: hypothetical protein GWP08_13345 [Nitrospiraceae bacterium]|nr:hypothetical protein [Nitrospiraceae bacterium]
MFEITKTITLRDADAAGVLFFARYLSLAHDVYEEFLAAKGISLRAMLDRGDMILPIVHAESDYRLPLWVGDQAVIQIEVAELAERRLTLTYTFLTPDGEVAATCRTIHVSVDPATRNVIPLPEELRAACR